jgi:hypothetical protein
MARTTGNASDLITFTRASTGTALTKVAYGPELVTNGGFDDATGWTLGAGWAVSTGTLNWSGGYNRAAFPVGAGAFEAGKAYQVTGTISNYTSGRVNAYIALSGNPLNVIVAVPQANGDFSLLLLPTATVNEFGFVGNDASGARSIDNISVREVLYNDPTGTLKLISHPTNKPRVEYDANGVAKGLLIEEARTNLVTYSEDFSNWNQVTNLSISLNSDVVSPFNEPVTKLTEDNANSYHSIQSSSMTSSTSTRYTYSIFAKAAERDKLQLLLGQSTAWGIPCNVKFNLTLGEVISIDSGTANVTASIQDYGNGWYRCIMSADRNSTVAAAFAYLYILDSSGNVTYQGDNTSGIYIWGAQFEQGSFPTSYIPTSGATATRSADIASVSVSEFGYNQAQGTVVVEANPILSGSPIGLQGIVEFNNGTTNDQITIINENNDRLRIIIDPTSAANDVDFTISGAEGSEKYAAAWATNDVQAAHGGLLGAGDTSSNPPATITTLTIGNDAGSSIPLNGHIKSINYYPLRLSDAKLQELTS